ncbi:MAG: hypothetical protein AAFQ51_03810 [Pseudomonadota bacterium]
MTTSLMRYWGFWAVLTGALALVLVFAQIVGPSFETKPSLGTQVGEIAGEAARSAWRSFLGRPAAAPEPSAPPVWVYLSLAAPIFGVLALILSAVSAVLRENWRFAAYGTGLAASAILFQLVWWMALLVLGMLLLIAIVENIGDFFDL